MNTVITSMWWIAPIASVFALIFAVYFYKKMMSANEGNETMRTRRHVWSNNKKGHANN